MNFCDKKKMKIRENGEKCDERGQKEQKATNSDKRRQTATKGDKRRKIAKICNQMPSLCISHLMLPTMFQGFSMRVCQAK